MSIRNREMFNLALYLFKMIPASRLNLSVSVLVLFILMMPVTFAGPLHQAVGLNDVKIVRTLLKQGVDIDEINSEGFTSLQLAAQAGNVKITDILIVNGANLDIQSRNGATPLILAISNDQSSLAEYLILAGASLNIQDNNGYAPLYWAIFKHNTKIAELLIKKGTDVNIKSKTGDAPLHLAARLKEEGIARFLLDSKAKINAPGRDDITPLHAAVRYGYINLVKLFLSNGSDINAEYSSNITPLHIAAKEGYFSIAKLLLEKEAEIDLQRLAGETALYEAARWGHANVVKLLLDNGADITISNSYQDTPLHGAVLEGYLDVVKVLIERGANINAKNGDYQTVLEVAEGNEELITILKSAGARKPIIKLTENIMSFMRLVVMALAIFALLPFTWRLETHWTIVITAALIVLYSIYEYLMLTRFISIFIRVDLLVIWPFLAAVIGTAVYRSTRFPPKKEGSNSIAIPGLAITSLTLGILAIFLNLLYFPSLLAIFTGHLAIYHLKQTESPKGRRVAFAGLVLGYIALFKELYMEWLIFTTPALIMG